MSTVITFPSEKFSCCHDGKIHLDDHPFPPELQRLFETADELSLHFRSKIRRYNTAFAFASLTAKFPPPPHPPGRDPPVFRICGQLYHNYAYLYPNNNNHPSFNQLYIYEPSEANNIRRLNPVTGECRPDVMEIIADILHNRNPYARFYRTMAEVERRERESAAAQNSDLGAVQPGHDAGTPLILPSSFMGSPRNMSEAYHDAMTVVRTLGSPDLFIAFTCNEYWPEIRDNLKPGQTPSDRPDLIARVFQMYHTEVMKDRTESHVLGRCISKINVIEFQKRGKPHCYILIHLDDADKIRCAADIDSIVSAEIPDPNLFPELYQVVSSCMMHGPCGGTFNITDGVCMRDGECTKAFPKPYVPHTVFSDNGYPVYRRLNDGRAVTKNGKHLTNQWVVPYNPYLLLKYRCHINVEICVSIKSIKYLFKYVYKGHDCAYMEFQRDTIKMYLDSRYICAPEAAHRLFEFKMRHSTFSVVRLPVHLQYMQSVFYKPGEE